MQILSLFARRERFSRVPRATVSRTVRVRYTPLRPFASFEKVKCVVIANGACRVSPLCGRLRKNGIFNHARRACLRPFAIFLRRNVAPLRPFAILVLWNADLVAIYVS